MEATGCEPHAARSRSDANDSHYSHYGRVVRAAGGCASARRSVVLLLLVLLAQGPAAIRADFASGSRRDHADIMASVFPLPFTTAPWFGAGTP